MIRKYAEIFCWKNVSSFCSAKATHIFSAKIIRIWYIESAKTVNEMTLNELVKLTLLWTTGPRSLNECFWLVWSYRPSQHYKGQVEPVSLPNHTFPGQDQSSVLVLILSPQTDSCPSWISRRERMTIENTSCSNQQKRENDHRKYFMLNLNENNVGAHGGDITCHLLITSWTHIQLSN